MSTNPDPRAELRQLIDDEVLTHTGRSIGDRASEQVAETILVWIDAHYSPKTAQPADRGELRQKLVDIIIGDSSASIDSVRLDDIMHLIAQDRQQLLQAVRALLPEKFAGCQEHPLGSLNCDRWSICKAVYRRNNIIDTITAVLDRVGKEQSNG